jgi:GNAT superfamily N-acetyltransferase
MLTAAPEPWSSLIEEMKPMLPDHYRELALDQDKVPLAPQFHVYDDRDARGEVMSIAMRREGELVGYFIGFVNPGLHYSTCLTLLTDIYWIKPEYRGQRGGTVLFDAVEKEARRRGVQRMFVGSKVHLPADWLFEHRGYAKVESWFSTWLGDE